MLSLSLCVQELRRQARLDLVPDPALEVMQGLLCPPDKRLTLREVLSCQWLTTPELSQSSEDDADW